MLRSKFQAHTQLAQQQDGHRAQPSSSGGDLAIFAAHAHALHGPAGQQLSLVRRYDMVPVRPRALGLAQAFWQRIQAYHAISSGFLQVSKVTAASVR